MIAIDTASNGVPGADDAANGGRTRSQLIAGPSAGDHADEDLGELELLYRTSPHGVCLLDRELRYIRLNERLAAMNGVPLEAHIGRTVREVVPLVADAVEPIFGGVFETGQPVHRWQLIGETPRAPGVIRMWFEDVFPIKGLDGSIKAILVCVQEAAPDDVAEPTAWLTAIIESSDDAIVSKTLDGTITSWNPAAERLFGYAAHEVVGRHISLLAAPGRESEMPEILARLRRGEKIEHYETVRRRKDGSLVDISLSVSPIRDRAGRVIGASKIARDITERRRVDQAVAESARRFRLLANTVPDIIWTADPGGAITFANDRWFEFCGIPPERDAREWPELVLHPDDRERCLEAWSRALRDGTEYQIEVRNRRHDGEYRWLLTRATPIRDDQGRITEWFGATTDIDDRKRAEEEQRLLAAELSHRVRNILAVVQVLASRTADSATSVEAYLDAFRGRLHALNAAHRALTAGGWQNARLSEIVSAILDPYAGDGQISVQIEDLALKSEVALTLTLALHELATNAAKYGALSGSSGRLTVSARIEPDENGGIFQLVWQEDNAGRPVRPPERTGFGLTMLRRAIDYQHAGRAELVWRDEGLLCRMALPLAEAAARPPR